VGSAVAAAEAPRGGVHRRGGDGTGTQNAAKLEGRGAHLIRRRTPLVPHAEQAEGDPDGQTHLQQPGRVRLDGLN